MSHVKILGLVVVVAAFILAACGGNQADTNGPVDVKVTLGEFTIKSSVTEFKPGVQYHFIVTNEGVVPHEFMIMPVEMNGMGMAGMSMEEKDALAFMMIGEEELPPGATRGSGLHIHQRARRQH